MKIDQVTYTGNVGDAEDAKKFLSKLPKDTVDYENIEIEVTPSSERGPTNPDLIIRGRNGRSIDKVFVPEGSVGVIYDHNTSMPRRLFFKYDGSSYLVFLDQKE